MKIHARWAILFAAAAYAAPTLVLAPLHALELSPGGDCTGCKGLPGDGLRLAVDCGSDEEPCDRPDHHHHRPPHHPGQCRVCSSLVDRAHPISPEHVCPPPALPVGRYGLPEDLVPGKATLPLHARGPPGN